MSSIEPLLTTDEVAKILRVDPMTLYRLIRTGEIHAVKVGGQYRWDGEEIRRYVINQKTVGGVVNYGSKSKSSKR